MDNLNVALAAIFIGIVGITMIAWAIWAERTAKAARTEQEIVARLDHVSPPMD